MVSSLYTAASGMIAELRKLDVVSNNLANVDTVGFKREGITFSDYFYHIGLVRGSARKYEAYPERPVTYWFDAQNAVVFPDEHYFNFSPGALKQTDNPLDVALTDRGFFVVQTPRGIMFTRKGNFHVGADGILRNVDGYEVLGRVAPNLPPEPVVLQPGVPVRITEDGWVVQNGNKLYQLEIRDFNGDYNRYLEAYGYGYFRAKDPKNTGFFVQQPALAVGYLETSNADVVREMVNLIKCVRHYEACQKAVQVTFEDATGRTVNDVGRVG